ncbi:hypothetical protein CNBC1970 [Cryptococcus deneoformans B-3501A]|uniref:hypothetical protein n=1 Tax=Cryptococcus deneoformans (strain B-3501A) TaxID=283643 RepID=UPI000042E78E|nr:hypothetical protein CNBC1970 [Cryptococcus neoformans var. neoformans B-3501A]EAL22059.1 hypothetical protein CNBC1970 [Cryptococcus neoformans var. neoformans B-3501A]
MPSDPYQHEYIDEHGDYIPSSTSSTNHLAKSSSVYGSYDSHPTSSSSYHDNNYYYENSAIYDDTTSTSSVGSPSDISQVIGNATTSVTASATADGKPHVMSLAGVIAIAVVGTLVIVGAVTFCCFYTRRRRRLNKLPGDVVVPTRKSEGGGRALERIETPTLHPPSTLRSNVLRPPSHPRMSHRDVRDVVLPQRPLPSAYPSSFPHMSSPFGDPSSSPTSGISRRRPESEYTDNSEFDMLAQDGSSYARTLSTYSEGVNSEYSERDLGTYVAPSSQATVMGTRPRLAVDTKTMTDEGMATWNYTAVDSGGSSGWESVPGSSSVQGRNFAISPFVDPPYSTSSSHLPPSQAPYLSQPSPSVVSDRSWRTEDDALLIARGGSVGSGARAAGGTGMGSGLRRGMTLVRHTDAGVVKDEVHLPPSYGELYP